MEEPKDITVPHKSYLSKWRAYFGDAALQYKSAFGLGRFAILGLYIFATLFTGCTHWGWDGIQALFYKSGAYEWLCDGLPDEDLSHFGKTNIVDCAARRSTINNGYTFAIGAEFIFSLAAGTIMDHFGPKVASLVGQVLLCLSWLCFLISSKSLPLYYLAMIFIGMATDAIYLPLLNLANLFPKQESFVLAVLGSARSLSFAVPVVFSRIFATDYFSPTELWKIVSVYIGLFVGPSILICMLVVPKVPFSLLPSEDEYEVKLTPPEEESAAKTAKSLLVVGQDQQQGRSFRSSFKSSSKFVQMEDGAAGTEEAIAPAVKSSAEGPETDMEDDIPFKRLLLSAPYVLVCIVFFFNLLRAEFYSKSHRDQLVVGESNAYTLFSILNILSCIPGPVMGYICDRFGVITALHVLNGAALLMYLFVTLNQIYFKVFSVVCMMFFISFVLSSLYCYINATFPKKHFGKLVGISSLIGGTLTLISIPLYNFANNTLQSFVHVDILFLCVGAANVVLIYLMSKSKIVARSENVKELTELIADSAPVESAIL